MAGLVVDHPEQLVEPAPVAEPEGHVSGDRPHVQRPAWLAGAGTARV